MLNAVVKSGLHVVILPNKEAAEYCASDLYGLYKEDVVFFLPDSGYNLEKSNYKSTLCVQRTAAVDRLGASLPLSVIVTYPEALSEKFPDSGKLSSVSLSLRRGEEIKIDELRSFLSANGFEKVDFVSSPGQYALRGGIADIFSFSENKPYRIDFFGDEIDKIFLFDCNTQLSEEERDEARIIPFISDGDGVSFRDILPQGAVLWMDSSDMYSETLDIGSYSDYRKVYIDTPLSLRGSEDVKFSISPQPVFNKNFELLSSDIISKQESGYAVYILGQKESQIGRLESILRHENCPVPQMLGGQGIHQGFIDNEDKVCCYSDSEIFDRFDRAVVRRSVEKSQQLTLNELNSFNIGDYIVHIDHGVGVFGGIVRMLDEKGRYKEVVKLMYKDGDVVFVSVHNIHKISRYKSKDSTPPKVNKLGSRAWQALKTGAKSKVKDIAKELIQLYSKRKASRGFAFSPDTYLQNELESSFIYEDTPDQMSASASVKRDMEDQSPMDRLVCGDVGFGKTEIAIRAAFKAACDSKQVAVLVPTTVLALQHFKTFTSRLENFPCSVEYVSRLRTAKEIADIRKRLQEGKIDILIGTHKILGKDFVFKDLGLLIIDEEQKFGVSAKEKLRQIKLSVDTLTLTATPIPRTLQFSLLGARDLSIINTPPPNRIPVQTELILFEEEEIQGIIRYELRRGGQIFFLHNKVEELESIYDILHRLVPDMKICVAHGQMEPKELENRMLDYMEGDYDMLLCTTIIENGLDIPNANTIIINQAQNFGLSDLHQLRGRVGRSNRKAFCYLIVPPLITISEDARRRLKAIEEFSDLGSGFNVAMQDLDIRGAGNLLGAEQSGFIADMGYEMYQKILAEAMEEIGIETGLRTPMGKDSYIKDCTIETDQPALIPDSYMDIPAEKIRIYKELDSTSSDKELDVFASRLEDRFGKLPQELVNLFGIVKLRHMGERLGFEKIIVKNGILIAFFISNPMSQYYKSKIFASVLDKVALKQTIFELKQNDGKLRLISRNIHSIAEAVAVMDNL